MHQNFENLLKRIAAILERLKISYFITGGYAVSVWGRPRATFDIDVVINLFNSKDTVLFARSLLKLGKVVYLDTEMMEDAIKNFGEFNVIHAESGIKIDFWAIENNLDSKQVLARRKAKKVGSQKVFFISPEDLILSKLRWRRKGGSDYHLEDAKSVIKKMGEKLDYNYLRNTAEERGLMDLLEEVLSIKF